MSDHVFVVSEWLAKENCDEALWQAFKQLMKHTRENEEGCIRAHATRQISHPGSPGTSKFNIVLLQEYRDIAAFDAHCSSDYVADFAQEHLESLVDDWTCRLFQASE